MRMTCVHSKRLAKFGATDRTLVHRPSFRKRFDRSRRAALASVRVAAAFETDDMDTVRAAVLAGLGIGALPTYIVGNALQQGRLVPLLRQFQVQPESSIYLVYLPNRSLPSRVRALIDFLTAWFGPYLPGTWVGESLCGFLADGWFGTSAESLQSSGFKYS